MQSWYNRTSDHSRSKDKWKMWNKVFVCVRAFSRETSLDICLRNASSNCEFRLGGSRFLFFVVFIDTGCIVIRLASLLAPYLLSISIYQSLLSHLIRTIIEVSTRLPLFRIHFANEEIIQRIDHAILRTQLRSLNYYASLAVYSLDFFNRTKVIIAFNSSSMPWTG